MISNHQLQSLSTTLKFFKKGTIIFRENQKASYFRQVEEGKVKMVTFTPDGKEVIQSIFQKGESFGEPAMIGGFPYPSRAVALTDCKIWILGKRDFINLLRNNFDLHFKLTQTLCNRMEFKSNLLQSVSIKHPQERILSFIDYLKKRWKNPELKQDYFVVPYTRQQLADSLALRVETVIRAIKELEANKEVKIINRKVCRPFIKAL